MRLSMKIVLALIVALMAIALTQIDFSGKEKQKEAKEAKEQIVATAFHSDNLSTFVAAIKTAGLKDTLSARTPITIFAPNDSAFASLPEGSFADLMDARKRDKLEQMVKSHVVSGTISFSEMKDGQVLESINGHKIKITLGDDESRVNNIKLVRVNIEATNGIIHVIDGVMMPGSGE